MALLVLKHNSVEADPKDFLHQWSPASFTPCSWLGFSCSASGQVIALITIEGRLLGSFGSLSFLNDFNVPNNNLTGSIPLQVNLLHFQHPAMKVISIKKWKRPKELEHIHR
ncbi:hypothetical protein PTKIN_Ptkin14bG0179300 [Pterospermum kingtungense]